MFRVRFWRSCEDELNTISYTKSKVYLLSSGDGVTKWRNSDHNYNGNSCTQTKSNGEYDTDKIHRVGIAA